MRVLPNRAAVLAFCLVAAGGTAPCADDPEPPKLLEERHLTHEPGSLWVLGDEATILRAARDAQALGARLKSGEAQVRELASGNSDPKAVSQSLREQASMLGQQIAMVDQNLRSLAIPARYRSSSSDYNALNQQRGQLVAEQRRLEAMATNVATQGPQFLAQKKQFETEVARLRAEHEKEVDNVKSSVEKAMAKYADLAKDEAVIKALAELSTSTKLKQKLGPSKAFLALARSVGGAGSVAQLDIVEVHHEGEVNLVDVQLGGGKPVRMVVDPAPGHPTVLPAALATKLGLKPSGHTSDLTLPDGTKVPAQEMVIPSVRVGETSAREVTCLVAPADKGDVPARLGQSFLQHFDAKLMTGAGRLVLIRTVTEEPASKPKAAPTARRKAPTRTPRATAKGKSSRRPSTTASGTEPPSGSTETPPP